MFQQLPSLKALHAFEAAARHCSFNAAAAELSVSQGAISYQVKQLETSLGIMLFHRRTRQVELTDAGLRLYHTVHRLFQELDDELGQILRRKNETSLTVSVSTYFVTRWLSPRLGKFLNAHSDITVRLQHSVNDPDFTVEDVDLAIRWGDGRWPNSQSEPLIEMPMIAVCAPSLLVGDSGIRQPADLIHHTLLYDQPGIDRWPEWLRMAGLDPAETPPGPVIVDPNVRVQSAIDGHGVVLGNPLLLADIESGRLSEPFDIRLEGYGYHMVFNQNAVYNEPLKLFHGWLHDEATQYIEASSSAR